MLCTNGRLLSFSGVVSEVSVNDDAFTEILWFSLGFCQKLLLIALELKLLLAELRSESRGWRGAVPSSKLTTFDIEGRSVGDALAHKRATFSIRSASSFEYSDPRSGSTSSKRVPLS